jgi:hypothetical protein
MALSQKVIRYAQRRLMRKLIRAVPYLGGLVAVVTVGSAMRRKGAIRGLADTALDMTPFVGAAKNGVEVVRGRDFFPDRPTSATRLTGS